MTRKKAWLVAVFALSIFVLLAAAFILFLRRPSFVRLKGGRDFNVVLISVDTLRADRLRCYGFSRIQTPTIDYFAGRGVKFTNCLAPTPLTLPSHASLLTGTLPLFHGVRDNGGFIVPQELEAVAELFQEKGYATSAFVAAYVLDSKWGLNQGFDYYFDQFDLSRFEKISLASVQRPANEVMDEALRWLETKKGEKFFTWIHLYDPHTPYEPPSPYNEIYPNHPYLGEIAYTDAQLQRLWDFLEKNDLVSNTFLVFTSDHGESLGEHQEATHGFFVYQEAIHVPLIFVTPFEKLQGLEAHQVVSLVDVMPTLLEMTDIPVPSQVQGASLMPLFFNPEKKLDSYAYAETFYPRFHFGWSELKSIQNGRFKLIIAPDIELYDLRLDPEEHRNLASTEPKILAEFKEKSSRLIEKYSQNAYELDIGKVDEETREKLAALGYIGSFTGSDQLKGKKLANPREKIVVFNELSRAREMGMGGNEAEAINIIKGVIADDPDINDAYFTMGNIFFKQGKYKEAIASFEQALERKPDDTFTVINIASSYQRMGKPEAAEQFLVDYIKKGFEDSQLYFILGGLKFGEKKYDEAISCYEQCLRLNADSASSHNALAAIYLLKEDLALAEKHIQEAVALNPKLSNVYYNLAQILEKKGLMKEAGEAYAKELEYSPKHYKASFNLSRFYRLAGREGEEEKYLRVTMDSNPDFPLSYFYLARIYLNRGGNLREAVSLVKKGIELKPEKKDLPLGYFLLADLYSRLGENVLSLEYARKGRELTQKRILLGVGPQ